MIEQATFTRAKNMFAALAAIAMLPFSERGAQMAALGSYQSHGHGLGTPNRVARGAGMASRRAARKARNVRRNRRAQRG